MKVNPPVQSISSSDSVALPRAYRVREVAEALHLPRSSVYALIKAGKFPAVRVGNCWIVVERDLREWLDSNRTLPRANA